MPPKTGPGSLADPIPLRVPCDRCGCCPPFLVIFEGTGELESLCGDCWHAAAFEGAEE